MLCKAFPAFLPRGKAKIEPIAFMGAEKDRLEMLFVSPKMRGRGVGKELLTYAVKNLGVGEVTVSKHTKEASLTGRETPIRFCI